MDNADLIVANGLFLEESLEDTIDAVESGGVPVLHVGESLDPIPTTPPPTTRTTTRTTRRPRRRGRGRCRARRRRADDHGDEDPHVWWDPTRIAAAVPLIADALVEAGARSRCGSTYAPASTSRTSHASTTNWTHWSRRSPIDQRVLVTNHDSLGYFADRYDFEVLGSVIPSSSSLAATSPAELDALAADIEATGVSAIFADTQNSSDDADALANRIGDVEVVSMLTDTLDEPGTDQGTYVGWLRQNVETIVEALGGAS